MVPYTLNGARLVACWGLNEGSLVYEGCNAPLRDGRICQLGPAARRQRQSNVPSPFQQSPNVRDRSGHVCTQDGHGITLYHFFVKLEDTSGAIHVCEMWESAGKMLFGFAGEEFLARFQKKDSSIDAGRLQDFVRQELQTSTWDVYVTHSGKSNACEMAEALSGMGKPRVGTIIRSPVQCNTSELTRAMYKCGIEGPGKYQDVRCEHSKICLISLMHLQKTVEQLQKVVVDLSDALTVVISTLE